MSSQSLTRSILKNVRKPASVQLQTANTEKEIEPFFATSSIARNRMNMIPSPAQAMTILRALNLTDLKNYPIEILEILLPLLKQLLNGQITLYKSIPDDVFVRLNNIVHDVINKSQLRVHSYQQHGIETQQEIAELKVDQTHIMQVLRAINAIPPHSLDIAATKRMKTVKLVLFALKNGNPTPLQQLLDSHSKEEKICADIIENALRRVHQENQ